MTPAEQAQQLRLAAELIETEHPWELKGVEEWHLSSQYPAAQPLACIFHGQEIRPVLATPPDGKPLHNPDALTAEQVGLGYRLTVTHDAYGKAQIWHHGRWQERVLPAGSPHHEGTTYRLPLSVPWPEAKPQPPPFQLPPPPPGMEWHREDGWEEGDLPEGYRPLVFNERCANQDEWRDDTDADNDCWLSVKDYGMEDVRIGVFASKHRTTRPLTFTHAGHEWTYHRPGDPMPCDGEALIEAVYGEHEDSRKAEDYNWDARTNVFGWRYAETTKQVELGPEDVPPGSWLKFRNGPSALFAITEVRHASVVVGADRAVCKSYGQLYDGFQINRSIPLTGKWDATAWEPCHKPKLLANG